MSRRPIALGAVGHLLLEITNNFLPVTYPLLMPLLGLSFTQIGLIALVHSTCAALPQPLLGAAAQRWGPERIIVISLAWTGVFMGGIGLAGSFGAALALAGLGGIGAAAFHPAGSMSVAAAMTAGGDGRPRRGAAMSLFSVGGNAGSALSPALMAVAMGLFGLPGTAAAAVVGVGSALLVWRLLVAGAPAAEAPGRRGASGGGDAAGGETAAGGERAVRGRGTAGLGRTRRRGRRVRQGRVDVERELRTGREAAGRAVPGATRSAAPVPRAAPGRRGYPVLPLALIVFFAMARGWFQLSIASFLPAWTAASLGSAAWPLVLLMGCVGAGSLSGGRLSDRIGRTRTVLGATLLMIPAHLVFVHAPPAAQIAAVAVLGAALGATLPVTIVMAQERRPHATGVAAGLVIGLGGLPAGIGASVTGVLADALSLRAALQWTVLAPALGALAVMALAILERDGGLPAPPRTPRRTRPATPAAPPP